MQMDLSFAEKTGHSETFFQDNFEILERGVLIFLGLWIGVYIIERYFQYRLAKDMKEKQPWTSFVPGLATLQWMQMGKVSLWWFALLLLPGVVQIFASPLVSSVVFLGVFLTLFVLWGIASFRIANIYQQPALLGGGMLCLPILRGIGMYLCKKRFSWPKWCQSIPVQIIILFLSCIGSILLLVGFFYLFGWISFGAIFMSFLNYLSDPSVTPKYLFDIFLQYSTF